MNAANQLGRMVGRAAACRALNVPGASLYRRLRPNAPALKALSRRTSPVPWRRPNDSRSLRFAFGTFPWQGAHRRVPVLRRTKYRILKQAGEVRERRDQLRHPNYQKPQLLATGPNQVWSWDITKLLGAVKWTYFYLYGLSSFSSASRPLQALTTGFVDAFAEHFGGASAACAGAVVRPIHMVPGIPSDGASRNCAGVLRLICDNSTPVAGINVGRANSRH